MSDALFSDKRGHQKASSTAAANGARRSFVWALLRERNPRDWPWHSHLVPICCSVWSKTVPSGDQISDLRQEIFTFLWKWPVWRTKFSPKWKCCLVEDVQEVRSIGSVEARLHMHVLGVVLCRGCRGVEHIPIQCTCEVGISNRMVQSDKFKLFPIKLNMGFQLWPLWTWKIQIWTIERWVDGWQLSNYSSRRWRFQSGFAPTSFFW